MSRLISKDFEELCSFLKKYNLSSVLNDADAKKIYSACHKKYYALLILTEELRNVAKPSNSQSTLSSDQFNFLQETCSDIGQAYFLTFNGCYKGAKLLLRSSIENHLKGICLDENSQIISTKSVYEVFDIAEETSVFSNNKKNLLDSLHNIYSLLCKDVHTAGIEHMSSIAALNYFPTFSEKECRNIQNYIQTLVKDYITSVALKFNIVYHKINYNHKEILNKEIIKEYKQLVQNIV